MKRVSLSLIVLALAALAASCAPAGGGVVVELGAGLSSPRAVNAGDLVTSIDSYRVVFTKVEIGNTEDDKFTLWEDPAGQVMDVAGTVSFDGVLPVAPGSYDFVRLTIGPLLSVDGSIDDAGTIYSGSGSVSLDQTVYIWGGPLAGAAALDAPILIGQGSRLSFVFDVAGTVAYQGGPAEAAILSVAMPSLDVIID